MRATIEIEFEDMEDAHKAYSQLEEFTDNESRGLLSMRTHQSRASARMSPIPYFQYHVSYHWTVDNHRFGSVQQGFGEDTVTLDGPLDSVDQLHELRKFLAEHHPDQPCEVVIIAWNLL